MDRWNEGPPRPRQMREPFHWPSYLMGLILIVGIIIAIGHKG